ncbi:MAG: phosphate regulon transcriptional regulator PhoB [Polynucleobacter sp.]|jgi:two-component system phosphate regulon response regulator PhoB
MPHRILVVEDEPSIAELIAVNLTHSGFTVERALQADEAMRMIRVNKPDLLILDWMMPGKSGVQFTKELRASAELQHLPILMLTAKGAEADKIQGLDSGADDYVTKPFSPKELISRVKALLRRNSSLGLGDEVLRIGPMQLDPITHRVTVSRPNQSDQFVNLGPTEFRLLQFFMSNPERVHSRSHLLDRVWGDQVYIEERTVDVHIKRLRAALAEAECDPYIETVRGSGYRITKTPS